MEQYVKLCGGGQTVQIGTIQYSKMILVTPVANFVSFISMSLYICFCL